MPTTIQLPIEIIAEIIATVLDGTDFDSEDPDLYPSRNELHPLAAAPLVSRTCHPECFGRLKNLRVLYLDPRISGLLLELAAGITSVLAAPRLCKLVLRGWDFAEMALTS